MTDKNDSAQNATRLWSTNKWRSILNAMALSPIYKKYLPMSALGAVEILSASVAEEASHIIEFLFRSAQTPFKLFPLASLSFHKAAA